MGDHHIRMLEYERHETDFFNFINESRGDLKEPLTPDSCSSLQLASPPKGLQCLLALTRLLEETVKIKMAEMNSEKDLADLLELRRQAERMGHVDPKGSHNGSHTNLHEKTSSDSASLHEEHRINGGHLDQVDHHHDHHKTKVMYESLKAGTQMLSGTLGKVKTRLLKTSGGHRESVLPSPTSIPSSKPNVVQRKVAKTHDSQQKRGISALVHASSNDMLSPIFSNQLCAPFNFPCPACQCDLPTGNSPHFCQRRLLTPPTPLDMGDVWFGASDTSPTQCGDLTSPETKSDSLLTVGNSNPSSPQVVDYENQLFGRQFSEAPQVSSPTQIDRFASLPDHLESFEVPDQNGGRKRTNSNAKKSEVSQRNSYEKAVKSNQSTESQPAALTPPQTSKPQRKPSLRPKRASADDRKSPSPTESSNRLVVDDAKQSNSVTLRKDIAKKFERWVSRVKVDNKEANAKGKVKAPKKKGGKSNFDRQRSMSADRAGLLANENEEEFEEKLRQWGIKQAQDPNYYIGRRSRPTRRTVESPARLTSREDETTPSPVSETSSTSNAVKRSSTSSNRSASIERGRRVSPSRHKRYSRSSQSSLKSSSEAISNSSQLSPPEFFAGERELRSVSADSLMLTDDNEDDSCAHRPLSLIAMPGSTEAAESMSPEINQNSLWNSDSQLLQTGSSQDVLRTINEDINKIRECKARRSDSSSDNSLEGSFQRIPTIDNSPFALRIPHHHDDRLGSNHSLSKQGDIEIEDPTVELPSHSICVDSGLVMKEDEFCPNMSQDSPSIISIRKASQEGTTLENNDNEINIMVTDHDSPKQTCTGDRFVPEREQPIILYEREELPKHITSPQVTKAAPQKSDVSSDHKSTNSVKPPMVRQQADKNSTTQNEVSKLGSTPPTTDKEKLVKKRSDSDSVSEVALRQKMSKGGSLDERLVRQPLEPLLSSQSVSLKTKLQRLSSLYDCDDGTDFKLKPEEPSGPYDVFKAPRISHARSRSEDGLIDDHERRKKKDKQKRKLSGSVADIGLPSKAKNTSKKVMETAQSLSSAASSQQVSPATMRKKLRPPVPVLDLVQKFDSQNSTTTSPAVSPTQTSAPAPQMRKIAEHLLQQSQILKPSRYTMDLGRHVREIPKEGAVQRARSIFMEMQES